MISDKNNPFEILGVSINASKEEIDRTFRKKIVEVHPDIHGNNEENNALAQQYIAARQEIIGRKKSQMHIPQKNIDIESERKLHMKLIEQLAFLSPEAIRNYCSEIRESRTVEKMKSTFNIANSEDEEIKRVEVRKALEKINNLFYLPEENKIVFSRLVQGSKNRIGIDTYIFMATRDDWCIQISQFEYLDIQTKESYIARLNLIFHNWEELNQITKEAVNNNRQDFHSKKSVINKIKKYIKN